MTSREEFVENATSIMGIHDELVGLGHYITSNLLKEKLRKLTVAFARESCPEKKCTGYCCTALLRDCGLEEKTP